MPKIFIILVGLGFHKTGIFITTFPWLEPLAIFLYHAWRVHSISVFFFVFFFVANKSFAAELIIAIIIPIFVFCFQTTYANELILTKTPNDFHSHLHRDSIFKSTSTVHVDEYTDRVRILHFVSRSS